MTEPVDVLRKAAQRAVDGASLRSMAEQVGMPERALRGYLAAKRPSKAAEVPNTSR